MIRRTGKGVVTVPERLDLVQLNVRAAGAKLGREAIRTRREPPGTRARGR